MVHMCIVCTCIKDRSPLMSSIKLRSYIGRIGLVKVRMWLMSAERMPTPSRAFLLRHVHKCMIP